MPTIIQAGDGDARSFNDDSSPDSRLTSGQKLSVNAQVLPESSLDWYYQCLQLCESIPGELKSPQVWFRFQGLPSEKKKVIWTTLSKVRVHIVDPRPYRKSFEDIVKQILPANNPTLLQQGIAEKQPWAIWLAKQSQIFTAQNIIDDSIGSRVHGVSKFLREAFIPFGGKVPNPADDFLPDLSESGDELTPLPDSTAERIVEIIDFGNDTRPLVRKASVWAAKSAATFHEALDCFLDFDLNMRGFPNPIVRRRMETRVLKSHTFDKGDQAQIDLLESARGDILRNLREPGALRRESPIHPYSQVDSRDAYLVQAADIAAGIASKILEMEHIVAVVSLFEYVTYNGRRLSISDAEEEMRGI